MTTKSLTAKPRVEDEGMDHRRDHRPSAPPTMSPRARTVNREWYPGLCTTCVQESTCTFPRSVERPVVSCDEFQGVMDIKLPARVENPRSSERFDSANKEWFPGLCMTCVKRDTCTFPKPEAGVFNCEEFE